MSQEILKAANQAGLQGHQLGPWTETGLPGMRSACCGLCGKVVSVLGYFIEVGACAPQNNVEKVAP